MTRDELILRTRQLIAEGERLGAGPSLTALQTWLQLSDDLLATAQEQDGGVLFGFGAESELFLSNTQLSALHKDSFTFF